MLLAAFPVTHMIFHISTCITFNVIGYELAKINLGHTDKSYCFLNSGYCTIKMRYWIGKIAEVQSYLCTNTEVQAYNLKKIIHIALSRFLT